MKQSELLELLRQKKVFNIWNLLKEGDFVLQHVTKESVLPARWIIYCVGKKFKDSPWYDHGGKSFSSFGGKRESLEEAKQYGTSLGVKEWVKTPWKDVWAEKDKYETALKKVLEDS